jgi:hypothetical protein
MKTKTKRILTIAALLALVALAVTGLLVFAQSGETSSGTAQSTDSTISTTFVAKVAKNLGIEESKLESAITAAQEETIDEALAAGRITEEQAAAMKERLAATKAMDELIADGVASGKITQEQADLAGTRGLGKSMMGSRGLAGLDAPCGDRAGRGMGR